MSLVPLDPYHPKISQGDGGVLPHHEPACQEAGNSDESPKDGDVVVLIEHGSHGTSADGSNPFKSCDPGRGKHAFCLQDNLGHTNLDVHAIIDILYTI